jgi:hypothetical protein
MNKPKEYFIIDNTTKEIKEYVVAPNHVDLSKVTPFIDTRYKSKLRLYKYVMFKKYGVKL